MSNKRSGDEKMFLTKASRLSSTVSGNTVESPPQTRTVEKDKLTTTKATSIEEKFHHAAKHADRKKIKRLLGLGVNIDCLNSFGQTALFKTCLDGVKKLVPFLLSLGANPNIRSAQGGTAVHAAAFRGNVTMLKLLVAAGGDLRLHDYSGRTMADWASAKPNLRKRKIVLDFLESMRRVSIELCRQYYLRSVSQASEGISKISGVSITDIVPIGHYGYGKMFAGLNSSSLMTVGNIPVVCESSLKHDIQGPTFNNASYMVMESMLWNQHAVTVKRLHKKPPKGVYSDLLISEFDLAIHLRQSDLLLLMGFCQTSNYIGVVLIYERIHCGSLHSYLHHQNHVLSASEVYTVMLQMCSALCYLHARGVIHSYVNSHAVQLVSPGCSKLSNLEYALHSDTTDGPGAQEMKVGGGDGEGVRKLVYPEVAYAWMPAEQLIGQLPSHRTDQYSICAVLWEMSTSTVPWQGLNSVEVVQTVAMKKKSLELEGIRDRRTLRLLSVGLQQESILRYRSMEQLRDFVDEFHSQIKLEELSGAGGGVTREGGVATEPVTVPLDSTQDHTAGKAIFHSHRTGGLDDDEDTCSASVPADSPHSALDPTGLSSFTSDSPEGVYDNNKRRHLATVSTQETLGQYPDDDDDDTFTDEDDDELTGVSPDCLRDLGDMSPSAESSDWTLVNDGGLAKFAGKSKNGKSDYTTSHTRGGRDRGMGEVVGPPVPARRLTKEPEQEQLEEQQQQLEEQQQQQHWQQQQQSPASEHPTLSFTPEELMQAREEFLRNIFYVDMERVMQERDLVACQRYNTSQYGPSDSTELLIYRLNSTPNSTAPVSAGTAALSTGALTDGRAAVTAADARGSAAGRDGTAAGRDVTAAGAGCRAAGANGTAAWAAATAGSGSLAAASTRTASAAAAGTRTASAAAAEIHSPQSSHSTGRPTAPVRWDRVRGQGGASTHSTEVPSGPPLSTNQSTAGHFSANNHLDMWSNPGTAKHQETGLYYSPSTNHSRALYSDVVNEYNSLANQGSDKRSVQQTPHLSANQITALRNDISAFHLAPNENFETSGDVERRYVSAANQNLAHRNGVGAFYLSPLSQNPSTQKRESVNSQKSNLDRGANLAEGCPPNFEYPPVQGANYGHENVRNEGHPTEKLGKDRGPPGLSSQFYAPMNSDFFVQSAAAGYVGQQMNGKGGERERYVERNDAGTMTGPGYPIPVSGYMGDLPTVGNYPRDSLGDSQQQQQQQPQRQPRLVDRSNPFNDKLLRHESEALYRQLLSQPLPRFSSSYCLLPHTRGYRGGGGGGGTLENRGDKGLYGTIMRYYSQQISERPPSTSPPPPTSSPVSPPQLSPLQQDQQRPTFGISLRELKMALMKRGTAADGTCDGCVPGGESSGKHQNARQMAGVKPASHHAEPLRHSHIQHNFSIPPPPVSPESPCVLCNSYTAFSSHLVSPSTGRTLSTQSPPSTLRSGGEEALPGGVGEDKRDALEVGEGNSVDSSRSASSQRVADMWQRLSEIPGYAAGKLNMYEGPMRFIDSPPRGATNLALMEQGTQTPQ